MSKIDFTKLDTYRRIFDSIFQIKGEVNGYSNLPVTAINGDIYKDKSSGRLYVKSDGKWLVTGMTEDDINLFSPEVYAKLSDVVTPKTNVLYLIGPKGTGEDKYEEYIYDGTDFVKIGDTTLDISSKQDVIEDLDEIREGALAVPDWNQNDSTKPDYIKNRTHYIDSPTLYWEGSSVVTPFFSIGGIDQEFNQNTSNTVWRMKLDDSELRLELVESSTVADEFDLVYSYAGNSGTIHSFASSTGTLMPGDHVKLEGIFLPEGEGVHKLDNIFLNIDDVPSPISSNPISSKVVYGMMPVIIKATQSGLTGDITLVNPTTGSEAYAMIINSLESGNEAFVFLIDTAGGNVRKCRFEKVTGAGGCIFQSFEDGIEISFRFNPDGTVDNLSTDGTYERTKRKVTSISASSTDVEYPSAKAVYDAVAAATAPSMTYNEMVTIWDSTFPMPK